MARAGTKLKAKRKQPKLSNKEQIERFKQTAREIGADETGESFARFQEAPKARSVG